MTPTKARGGLVGALPNDGQRAGGDAESWRRGRRRPDVAAPPVLWLADLFPMLRRRGWIPHPVLTPVAATWSMRPRLSGCRNPLRVEPRSPGEEDPLPLGDTVLAAPLTFNTLNKLVCGISDTLALGLLNELLGADAPIIAAPCIKPNCVSIPHTPWAAAF